MLLDTEAHETPLVDWALQGTTMLDTDPAHPGSRRAPEQPRRASLRARRLAPLALMVAGVAISAGAAMVLVPHAASVPGEALPGVSVGGPSDVASQLASYPPGQSSGWHSHTGLHAVVVLAGTLTIVDGECQRQTYGAGDSYVGGRDIHVALNETAAPLEMAVTYMFPAGVSHTAFHVPVQAPVGCQIR